MKWVEAVLAVAVEPGYLLEDTTDGPRVWCARGPSEGDPPRAALVPATAEEADMVTGLCARGWLRRGGRAQARIGLRPGRASGQRRTPVTAHPVVVPPASAHALARWSALTALPGR